MADTKREVVYELRIENGQALSDFERINRKLIEVRQERTRLTKSLKESIDEERRLSQAVGLSGRAEEERQQALSRVRAVIQSTNKALSEATIQEKFYAAQTRELSNDLGKLTELGLRFRDKMADATVEALKQSGALEQLGTRAEFLSAELSKVNGTLGRNEQKLNDLQAAYKRGEVAEQQYREEAQRIQQENADLIRSNQALERELGTVTGRLDKAEQEVKQLNEAFRQGRIGQDEYRRGIASIEESTRGLSSKFDAFVRGQSAELKNTLSSLALQYVGVGAAIYGVQQVLGSAVNAVVNFDQALANVRALGGEYRANIDALGEAARNLGPQFGVGASEALKAVEALAKAGVSAADILAGGLEGALALSAAGTLEVGAAAEIAASALTQFKLQGEDLTRVADLLASGSLNAQGSVQDLGAALNQSGLVAASFGIPVEEAVAALSSFASAGLIGSDAGTSFKTMLQSLVPRSKEAADKMAELGLNFFDAQGQFIGLEGVAGQLQQALAGLSEEQQQAALKTIFGSDAVRAATVLYEQGAEGIQRWTDTVSQSGVAGQVASDNLNSLSGSFRKASAAWEGFVLSIENGQGVISTVLRSITDDAARLFDALASGDFASIGSTATLRNASNLKDALAQIDKITGEAKAKADAYNNSLEGLKKRLADLNDRRQANLTGGMFFGGVEDDLVRQITEVEALIAAKEKQANVTQQTTKKEVDTLATLRSKLQELQTARETIALADSQALQLNANEILSIQNKIEAIEGQTKALSAQELQARATKAEMDALAGQAPEATRGNSPQVTQAPLSGQPTTYTAQQVEAMQANLDAMLAMYDSERQAYDELQNAKIAAVGGFAQALGSLAKEGSAAAKVMLAVQKAAAVADVISRTQQGIVAAQVAASSVPPLIAPGVPNPAYAVAKAIEAATITRLKISSATSIATILAQAIQGFATGGEVSGDIRPTWGASINRSNGDNVLITAKVGEKILNEDQQKRLERITGRDVWGAIGLPGYALGGSVTRGTALVNATAPIDDLFIARLLRTGLSGLDGGIDVLASQLATPRPAPSTVVQSELLEAFRAYAERPSIVAVQDINSAQARVQVIENASRA